MIADDNAWLLRQLLLSLNGQTDTEKPQNQLKGKWNHKPTKAVGLLDLLFGREKERRDADEQNVAKDPSYVASQPNGENPPRANRRTAKIDARRCECRKDQQNDTEHMTPP
jgi:hypothetical protein